MFLHEESRKKNTSPGQWSQLFREISIQLFFFFLNVIFIHFLSLMVAAFFFLFFLLKVQNAWAHVSLSCIVEYSYKEERPECTSDKYVTTCWATVATFEVNSGLCKLTVIFAMSLFLFIHAYTHNKIFDLAQGSVTKIKNLTYMMSSFLSLAALCTCPYFVTA